MKAVQAVLAALAFGMIGCTAVSTVGVDNSCEIDTDCVAAISGPVCDCVCPSEAINADATQSHEQNVLWAQTRCPLIQPDCAYCGDPVVECRSGSCVFVGFVE